MTIEKSVFEKQLGSLGEFHKFLTRREIRFLPEVLAPTETVHAVTSGFYETKSWVIVVTDMRVLFLDCGLFFGVTQVDMPLSQISSVAQRIGFFFGEIEVATSSGKRLISRIPRRYTTKVASVLAAMIHRESSHSDDQSSDVASQLEKVEALWQKGVLTDIEFERAKAKIIGQTTP